MHESGCWGSLLKQPAVNPGVVGQLLGSPEEINVSCAKRGYDHVLTHDGKRMTTGLFKSNVSMKSIGIPMAGLILNSSESFVH